MLLGEILHHDVVKPRMEARNKTEAIEELIDLLVEAHEIPLAARDHALEAVMHRERSMSTGMEHGIALPHGASEKITDIVGAMGLAPSGIPFDSLDGQPATIIILLLLPRDNFQGHVRTLAGIAHLLNSPSCREGLLNAKDAEAILAYIEQEEDRDVFYDLRDKS